MKKNYDPTVTESHRTQPSRSAKTNPIDRFGVVAEVSKCGKLWKEAINMKANMSRKNIEDKEEEVASAKQEEFLWWFRNRVFTPVRRNDLLSDANVIPHKWVVSQKNLPDQMGKQVKCRLVVVWSEDQRGNMGQYSPTIGKETIKVALQIFASRGFRLKTYDFKKAYINATITNIHGEGYTRPPRSANATPGTVWKLNKALPALTILEGTGGSG